jgi:hypothetical protein
MQGPEWQDYRSAVQELDAAVKRPRRLLGKEFEEEHQRIEAAEKTCEAARRVMLAYLRSDK